MAPPVADRADPITPWPRIAWVCTGLLPLFGLVGKPPDTTLLIYSCFVAAVLLREKIGGRLRQLPGAKSLQLLLAFWIAGALTETFAWMSNYLKAAEHPALFHPQLLADLLIALGFYGGWALAWAIALRWFRFSLREAFVVTGLQGIFFEQLGGAFVAIVRALPARPLLALLMGLYVFAVHGSAVGLGLIPVLDQFDRPNRSGRWVRFPVVIALMVGFAFGGCWLIGTLALPFGGLPPKRSIVDQPWW